MTDSAANLGRATLFVDINRDAFNAELERIRQEVERFAPNFGGIDQVLRGVANSVNQLEQALQGAGQQAEELGRRSQQVGRVQEQGFELAGRSAIRFEAALNQVVRQLQTLQRTPVDLNERITADLASLGEAFRDARAEAVGFATGVVNGQQALANTTAAVNQQAAALATLAANTSTASNEFNTFVQAREVASQRLSGRLRFDELGALERTYQTGNVGREQLRRAQQNRNAAVERRDALYQQSPLFSQLQPGQELRSVPGQRLSADERDAARNRRRADAVVRQRTDELYQIRNLSSFRGAEELLQTAVGLRTTGSARLGASGSPTPITPAVINNLIGLLQRARENTNLGGDLNLSRRLGREIDLLEARLRRLLTPLRPEQSVVPPLPPLLPPGDSTRAQFRGGAVPINRFAQPATYDRLAAEEEARIRRTQRITGIESYYNSPRGNYLTVREGITQQDVMQSARFNQERAALEQAVAQARTAFNQTTPGTRQFFAARNNLTGQQEALANFSATPQQPLVTAALRPETPELLRKEIQDREQLLARLQSTSKAFGDLTAEIEGLRSRLRQVERGGSSMRASSSTARADQRAFRQAQEEELAARANRINELRQRPAQIEFLGRGGFRDFSSGAEERVQARARQVVIDRIEAQRRLSSRSGLTSFLQDIPVRQAQLQAERTAELQRQREALQNLPFGASGPGATGRAGRGVSRLREGLTQGLIGGTFPLLFGQPPASAIGGGFGGLLGGLLGSGGGFAGGLVGTALGQGLTSVAQSGVGLADILKNPIQQFQALKEASGLSSKGLEKNVESLISQGRTAEASALIQNDLARSFGDLAGFRAYQDAQDKLARTFERVKVSIGSLIAGPLTSFLEKVEYFLRLFRLGSGTPGGTGQPGSPRPVFGMGGNSIDALEDPLSMRRMQGRAAVNAFIEASPTNRSAYERFLTSRGRRLVPGRTQLEPRTPGEDFGITVRDSDRLREDFGRSRGVLSGPVITQPAQAERRAQTLAQERADQENARIQRLRGSAAFYQSRNNPMLAAERDLQAFDANRANRLAEAGTDPQQQAGVRQQLTQERYQLELRISAERRQQAALAEKSANKVLALQEQTSILRKTPFISDRDARLLQEQAALNESIRRNREAQNAAAANRDDPALQRNAVEAAAALATAGQKYRNAVREAAIDLRRSQLDTQLTLASLRERGAAVVGGIGLSGIGQGVLQARTTLNDSRRELIKAQDALKDAPGNVDLQNRAAVAAERLRTAGLEFRAYLVQAFEAAQREAQQLGRTLRDQTVNLASLRTSREPGSLNSYLPAPLVAQRDQLAFQALLPQFNAAKQRLRSDLNNPGFDINFRGPTAQVNQDILKFLKAVTPEQDLQEDLATTNRDLAKATASLQTVMGEINKTLPAALISNTKALADLAGKDWRVYVAAGSAPGASGPGSIPVPTAGTAGSGYGGSFPAINGRRVTGFINGTPIYEYTP